MFDHMEFFDYEDGLIFKVSRKKVKDSDYGIQVKYLVWAYHHGDMSSVKKIRNIDGNGRNNRIENLFKVARNPTLRDVFDYHDGKLFYKRNGQVATGFKISDRIEHVSFRNRYMKACDAIWQWHHGRATPITHINGYECDNRIENLKEVSFM